nr:MAG TPA: hypothetical protein [Caudoviricetes sp.]
MLNTLTYVFSCQWCFFIYDKQTITSFFVYKPKTALSKVLSPDLVYISE